MLFRQMEPNMELTSFYENYFGTFGFTSDRFDVSDFAAAQNLEGK